MLSVSDAGTPTLPARSVNAGDVARTPRPSVLNVSDCWVNGTPCCPMQHVPKPEPASWPLNVMNTDWSHPFAFGDPDRSAVIVGGVKSVRTWKTCVAELPAWSVTVNGTSKMPSVSITCWKDVAEAAEPCSNTPARITTGLRFHPNSFGAGTCSIETICGGVLSSSTVGVVMVVLLPARSVKVIVFPGYCPSTVNTSSDTVGPSIPDTASVAATWTVTSVLFQ